MKKNDLAESSVLKFNLCSSVPVPPFVPRQKAVVTDESVGREDDDTAGRN